MGSACCTENGSQTQRQRSARRKSAGMRRAGGNNEPGTVGAMTASISPSDGQEMNNTTQLDKHELKKTPNKSFYLNLLRCKPDRLYIDDIHERWYGDYNLLEEKHGYIQWLFPIRESGGMNWDSARLSSAEATFMAQDESCRVRYLRSYKMMLDFYGMVLIDENTGELGRDERLMPSAPAAAQQQHPNWKYRFRNLKLHSHNNLRLSRIIQSHQLLGFHPYAKQLVLFLLHEVLKTTELQTAALVQSVPYWIKYLAVAEEREECWEVARGYGWADEPPRRTMPMNMGGGGVRGAATLEYYRR